MENTTPPQNDMAPPPNNNGNATTIFAQSIQYLYWLSKIGALTLMILLLFSLQSEDRFTVWIWTTCWLLLHGSIVCMAPYMMGFVSNLDHTVRQNIFEYNLHFAKIVTFSSALYVCGFVAIIAFSIENYLSIEEHLTDFQSISMKSIILYWLVETLVCIRLMWVFIQMWKFSQRQISQLTRIAYLARLHPQHD